MAPRLNWEKRAFDLKPKRALKDEEEFRKTDWAARFIARAEQSPRVRPHHHRKAAAVAKREADADRRSGERQPRGARETAVGGLTLRQVNNVHQNMRS
jgi:hypothetical protein